MKKIIFILIVIFILLLIPLPYYLSEDEKCMEKPCPIGIKCNSICLKKGLHLGNPLIVKILYFIPR